MVSAIRFCCLLPSLLFSSLFSMRTGVLLGCQLLIAFKYSGAIVLKLINSCDTTARRREGKEKTQNKRPDSKQPTQKARQGYEKIESD